MPALGCVTGTKATRQVLWSCGVGAAVPTPAGACCLQLPYMYTLAGRPGNSLHWAPANVEASARVGTDALRCIQFRQERLRDGIAIALRRGGWVLAKWSVSANNTYVNEPGGEVVYQCPLNETNFQNHCCDL